MTKLLNIITPSSSSLNSLSSSSSRSRGNSSESETSLSLNQLSNTENDETLLSITENNTTESSNLNIQQPQQHHHVKSFFFKLKQVMFSKKQNVIKHDVEDGEEEEEHLPLLENEIQTHTERGHCWACWEIEETPSDPLIRVCLGCRDPDLQWIHQSCINKYISALPPRESNNETNNDTTNNNDNESLNSTDEQDNNNSKDYYCTRCKDVYKVKQIPIPAYRILFRDQFLLGALLLMAICVGTLTFCCVLLLVTNWSSNHYLFKWGFFGLKMTTFAFFMLVFCHIVNILTVKMVLQHCSGQSEKHVFPIVGNDADGDDEDETLQVVVE